MKDITVKVYDEQKYDTHRDSNETAFKGKLAFKNDSIYITYKDEEMGVATTIKTKNGIVWVKRTGNLNANLEFNANKPQTTIYSTPYGEMEIHIITKKCEVYILEQGVEIQINYQILMQNEHISDNIYMVLVR